MKTNFNKPSYKFLFNKYVLIIFLFAFWLMFLDENSFYNQRELRNELEEMHETKDFYQEKIKSYNAQIKELQSDSSLEKFAREKYLMKKKNEVIYIIEIDSVK